MKRRFTLIGLSLVFVLISCDRENLVMVSGKIADGANQVIYLDEVNVSQTDLIDSVEIKRNEKFIFKKKIRHPSFFQIRNEKDEVISFIAHPGDRIKINTTYDHFANQYEIHGSTDSKLVKVLNSRLVGMKSKKDSIISLIKKDEKPGYDTLVQEYIEEYNRIYKEHKKFLIQFLLENNKSLASIVALYQGIDSTYFFNTHRDIQFFKIINDTLSKYYPGAKHVIALGRDTRRMVESYNKYRLLSSVETVESSIPDIRLPDLTGDTIALSSLKGKVVLLSYWASWNKESIKYNLELLPIYDKYRKMGFEVYQVSLDEDKDSWGKAVRYDELPWINVSDLESVNSRSALVYNVRNLPANYLINKTQTDVLGKNLTIRELKIKLNRLFK